MRDLTHDLMLDVAKKAARHGRTSRVDSFIRNTCVLELDPKDFADRAAMVRVVTQIRNHMIGWAEFARELESELNRSIPQEWKGTEVDLSEGSR